jgi:hypothetical protein
MAKKTIPKEFAGSIGPAMGFTEQECRKITTAISAICERHNLAIQNGQVFRQTTGRIMPDKASPPEWREHPEAMRDLLKVCNKYWVKLSAERLFYPYEPGMNRCLLAFQG